MNYLGNPRTTSRCRPNIRHIRRSLYIRFLEDLLPDPADIYNSYDCFQLLPLRGFPSLHKRDD